MPNVCPICNNPLRQYGKDFYVCEVCETYFDKNENIVLTEQEWIQTCTTEQLAEILVCMAEDKSEAKTVHKENVKKCVWWLKQPYIPLKNDEK